MTKPTVIIDHEIKADGTFGRTIKKFSYVVTLCEIGDDDVAAIRMDYFRNKTDVYKEVEKRFPGWIIKAVNKLYDEDFKGEC